MARPLKLDRRITDQIVVFIRAGNFTDTAARASGISPSTFYMWQQKGQAAVAVADETGRRVPAPDVPFVEFALAVEKARAEAEATMVLRIVQAAVDPKTWQAAAWYLERVNRERWGKSTRTELTGAGGGPVAIRGASDADLLRLAGELAGETSPFVPPVEALPEDEDL